MRRENKSSQTLGASKFESNGASSRTALKSYPVRSSDLRRRLWDWRRHRCEKVNTIESHPICAGATSSSLTDTRRGSKFGNQISMICGTSLRAASMSR